MMNPNKGNSSLNTLVGIIDNALSQVSTAMPVTVLQVYENHTVDVMPMVDMLDNAGNAVEHAPITSIPYARLQGGDYGLIIEPKVGDKGLVVFASRDISDVVQSKGKAKPASLRKHSMSDGMYIASLLYEEPETYLKIEKEHVTIHTKNLLVEDNKQTTIQTENFLVEKNDKTTIKAKNLLVDDNDKTTIKAKDFLIDDNVTTTLNCLGTFTISGTSISLTATSVNIIGLVNITGDIVITGDATIDGVSFLEHTHKYSKGTTSPPEKDSKGTTSPLEKD